MDSAGNLAIGFQYPEPPPGRRSGAGRLVTDLLGALSQGEADIAVGTGAHGRFRTLGRLQHDGRRSWTAARSGIRRILYRYDQP
jgi:hypothetical protein